MKLSSLKIIGAIAVVAVLSPGVTAAEPPVLATRDTPTTAQFLAISPEDVPEPRPLSQEFLRDVRLDAETVELLSETGDLEGRCQHGTDPVSFVDSDFHSFLQCRV